LSGSFCADVEFALLCKLLTGRDTIATKANAARTTTEVRSVEVFPILLSLLLCGLRNVLGASLGFGYNGGGDVRNRCLDYADQSDPGLLY
jgi:hypothetical protein